MKDMVTEMAGRLLRRQPTADEYRTMNELLRELPPEFSSSPAQIAFIVLMTDMLSRFEEIVKKASWDAQQRIHKDLPARVETAALHALNRLRDTLPIDRSDRLSRVFMWTSILVATVGLSAGTLGFAFARSLDVRANATQNVMAERGFSTCMYAAAGAAAIATGKSANAVAYNATIYQARARICAAEYADRRAGGA